MTIFTAEDHIKYLEEIIAIQSVNGGEHEVALYVQDLFKKHRIDSTIQEVEPGRSNLIATIGSGKPVIALSGHFDVVDPGNPDAWESDPFTLTERDGKLYGRGTNDMKAGLLNLVFAMIELNESGALEEGKGTIKFMGTVGEEVGGAGAKKLYETGYSEDIDYLWVTEPSVGDIIYSHKGSMNFRVDSYGLAAHSSAPELGHNAITTLAEFILKMNEKFAPENLPENELLGKPAISGTIIHGGHQVNSIPEHAYLEINARTIPEYDNETVKAAFKELEDEFNQEEERIKVTCTMDLNSVFTDGKTNFIKHMKEVGSEVLGHEVGQIGSGGVTDAASLLIGKDESFGFAMFGPGRTPVAHTVDEYVDKDYYLKFTEIVKEVVLRTLADYNK